MDYPPSLLHRAVSADLIEKSYQLPKGKSIENSYKIKAKYSTKTIGIEGMRKPMVSEGRGR
jgi:hypothetical protein